MSTETKTVSLLEDLIENTITFDEATKEFDDSVDCYRALRDTAKETLGSFDEYLQFYQVCIDQGPTGFVYYDLNQNAVRSIKNMAIQESTAGKRFPIHSTSELEARIDAYQDLDVNNVTSRAVASAILEHIYENHEDYVYELVDNLLDTPAHPSSSVELFTQARFVAIIHSVDREADAFHDYLEQFVTSLPDPRPTDERSAGELWKASQQTAYKKAKKVELAQASLVRDFSSERASEYLYLSARDVVERYRHGHRDNPHRGELQLARRQIGVLLAYFDDDYSAERNTRLKSYQKIILGQLSSGNWWRSQQDIANRPEPNFHTAASHFYEAAYIIKSVDENRYIKYFSKAIRNQTKAAVRDKRGPKAGWDVSHQLHMTVADTVSSLIANPDRNVQKTITETEALHRCLGHRAHATAACFHGNPEQIREQVNRTWDVLNDNEVPVYIDHDFLKALKTLATGYECEYDHRFSDAIEHYESINIPQEQIPVKQRKGLVEIKRAIKSNKYDSAVKTANDVFVDGAPIKTAVEIIADESPSSPRLKESELDQLIGTAAETLWAFRMFTDFVRQIEDPSSPVKTQLESMILEL